MLMFLASMSRDGACHEKRVIQVLLELVASGIISVDKLNLKDMIYLPAIPFLNFEPRCQEPEPQKRLRPPTPNVSRPR